MASLGQGRRGRKQRNALWVAPVVGALVATLVAAAALGIDHAVNWRDAPIPIFMDSADTARTLLQVIGGSVATLLSLIFTVIAVVIQLATGQYTPRALPVLLGDRQSHFTIGVFVGTFTYTLILILCLRVTKVEAEGDMVAGLSLTLAFLLAVISLATFAVYSNHIIHSSRVASIISRISNETRLSIERLYPRLSDGGDEDEPQAPDGEPDQRILARQPGVLVDVDGKTLLEQACDHDCCIVIKPNIGTFVPEGAVLAEVYGAKLDSEAIYAALELGITRNFRLDVAFGLRQLVDIAARALSTGINDPATAVQVVDQLHDLLRRLAVRQLSDASRSDADGQARLIVRMLTWDEALHLTFDELRRFADASPTITRRLRAALLDLCEVAPPWRRESIEQQLTLLQRSVDTKLSDPHERALASEADMRGTGF